ncbi:DNA polymerase III subunit gamma and tau [Microbacterium sp. Leaf151]|uniref:DNA polymerase III subunit gamma and tau n=1 Tax=Microbacterium sp. Leaf151 TaxID=1736276 RepID=UPI000700187A|nr:DNA polymerase III subunit gamma and tau [Microbacterium sp. Leaf151]KQR23348.1 DNA polymerase III subunit gamma/tau [Microbacterium sp. Leaf151]
MTTALYRRYRPEAFGEMIGQSQVTEPLMTALRSDRVGHAYLFSGPRGCGKTTSARILARCLNCAAGPTDTPCGTCDSCVELGRGGGGSLDVVEIDAASHNGVDDARDLRERAIFAPARDRFKIFILDEAHMVTQQGFNALLKLVEEPPAHVKFIFATTEPEKVLGTIRSRTHHYPFRLVPPAAMLEYVHELCETEGVGVEAGVLPLVVRAGGGSPRDTLSLLDQLIAGSDPSTGSGTEPAGHVLVRYERAVALLGYTHSELLDEVVDAFASNDGGGAFAAVDRVVQTGQDPRRFVDDLLERLRDLIIVAATGAGASAVLRGVPDDELERMARQATAFGVHRLSRTADLVVAALDEMTGATSPRLQLELLVARVLTHAGVSQGTSPAAAHDLEAARGTTSAAPQLAPATGRPASPAADIAAPGRTDAAPASPRVATPAIASPGGAAPESGASHVSPPRVASPSGPSPSFASTGIASPGASTAAPAAPRVAAPAVASPGVATSGVATPAIASPGATAPPSSAPAPAAETASPASPQPSDAASRPSEAPARPETTPGRGAFDDDAPPLTDDDAPPPFDDPEPVAEPGGRGRTPAARAAADAHPFDTAPTPETTENSGAAPTPDTTANSGRTPDPAVSAPQNAADPDSTAPASGDLEPAAAPARAAAAPPTAADDTAPPAAADDTASVPAPAASEAATDDVSPLEATAPTPPVTPVGPIELGHLRDAWPEILAQLEVASRASWLVVSTATVRAFDDDVLTLSFRAAGDLNAFKTRTPDGGASEDLRQAIQTVLGVRVKYLARLDGDGPGGSGPGAPPRGPAAGSDAPRGGASASAPSAPRSAAPYTASVTEWAVAPIPSADVAGAGAPTTGAPSAASPLGGHTASAGLASTALAVDDEPDEAAATPETFAVHPGVVLPPREVTPSVPAPDEVDDDDVIPPADDVEAPLPPVVVPRMAPLRGGVQRYGEAVVRQVLSATYVRDEPYEPPTRFS